MKNQAKREDDPLGVIGAFFRRQTARGEVRSTGGSRVVRYII